MFNNIDYSKKSEDEIDLAVINACEAENLPLLSYLLLNEKKHLAKVENYDDYFSILCGIGNLPMVKWMVEHCGKEINFESDNYNFLKQAAQYGSIEVLDYLLNDQEVKELGDLSCYRNGAYQYACTNCELEIIDYLIHALIKDNKNNPNLANELQTDLESGLYYASLSKDYSAIEHFIINWDIQLEEGVEQFLERLPYDNTDGRDMVKNVYEKRELYKKINHTIDDKKTPQSNKKKI